MLAYAPDYRSLLNKNALDLIIIYVFSLLCVPVLGKHQVCVYNFGFELPESHRGQGQAEETESQGSMCQLSGLCQMCHCLHSQAVLLK